MSQLGRAGRRALPVLQQVGAAPGVLQQFSSAADARAAGRGQGRGSALGDGPSAPGSGSRPQRGMGRGGSARQNDGGAMQPQQRPEDSGSSRQPGAMSQLLQSRRRTRGGRPGGPFPGRDDGSPEGDALSVQAPGSVPAELRDSPRDILTRFQYALHNPNKPDEPPIPLSELITDIDDVANLDNLQIMKYLVTPREWATFCSGDMSDEDQALLAERLATNLVADDRYRERRANVKAAIEADPDYDLAASLGSVPRLRGSPRPRVPSQREVEREFDSAKEELMAEYGLSEEEYQAAKLASVRQLLAELRAAATPAPPDHLKQAARLTELLDRALPREHPYYEAARQRIQVLQSNPGWPHERKMVFAKRLLKRLAAA